LEIHLNVETNIPSQEITLHQCVVTYQETPFSTREAFPVALVFRYRAKGMHLSQWPSAVLQKKHKEILKKLFLENF